MTARLREMEETAEWHDGRWPSPEEAPMGGRLSLESRFPSFEEAIDVADECVNDVTLAAKRWRCVRLRRC